MIVSTFNQLREQKNIKKLQLFSTPRRSRSRDHPVERPHPLIPHALSTSSSSSSSSIRSIRRANINNDDRPRRRRRRRRQSGLWPQPPLENQNREGRRESDSRDHSPKRPPVAVTRRRSGPRGITTATLSLLGARAGAIAGAEALQQGPGERARGELCEEERRRSKGREEALSPVWCHGHRVVVPFFCFFCFEFLI